jgi:predicted AlkP superfamily phosphohydrolase/phosphomutase
MLILMDGAEPELLDAWVADGRLPAFAALREGGGECRLDNPMGTLPGALWREIFDSCSSGNHGFFYHQKQLRSGSARFGRIARSEVDATRHFWNAASRSGLRCAVLDVPDAVAVPDLDGIQLLEWGVHEPEFAGTQSLPESFLDEVNDRFGPHPVRSGSQGSCDRYPKTDAGCERLLADLEEGLNRREALFLDVLNRETWDLFVCSASELHCAGHHLWRYHDVRCRDHDPGAPERLRHALATIYQRVDRLLGKLTAAAGTDCNILFVAPKGMTDLTGGIQLLPEVVARLGLSSNAAPEKSLLREAQFKVKQMAPKGLYRVLRRIAKTKVVDQVQRSAGVSLEPFESPATKAAPVPNNRIGAIRLNLKGRDPHGEVAPGDEARAILKRLSDELMALRVADSGEPAVRRVLLSDELYGEDRHPDLPDLLVEFRQDLGPIEAVSSPSLGTVARPFGKILNRRSGDHTANAVMIAKGPGFEGYRLADGGVLDIAPTVLALLGVAIPNIYEGQSLLRKTATAT